MGSTNSPCSFKTGSRSPNRACSGLRWCRSPTQSPDRPQIAAQGRVWFLPARWRFSGGSPSLSEIPYKNSGRRKKHLCHAFGNPSRLSSLSRASVFQNRREKIAFLCLAAQILRCHSRTPGRMLHGIFAHKQRTRPFHGRVLVYHLILWRDGSPSPARSNLYATASWMGRIVYRSTPFFTLPSLPWTVVFSVSMSLFSSNRCTYFRTVLGLIPVHWPIRLKLGQH